MDKEAEKDIQALCRIASQIVRHCRRNYISIHFNGVDNIPLLDDAVTRVEALVEPWMTDEEIAQDHAWEMTHTVGTGVGL